MNDSNGEEPVPPSGRARVERRLELAAGHWELGEHPEAVVALERAVSEEPRSERIAALAEGWLQELDPGCEADLRERLHALCVAARADGDLPPVATSTVAELLAEQGHVDQAQRVADEVLRRNPTDERALTVRRRLRPVEPVQTAPTGVDPGRAERISSELERWLGNLERRRFEGVYGTATQRGGLR